MNHKKLMYSILKELEEGNTPSKEDYDLDLEQWGEIAEVIINNGFAEKVTVQPGGFGKSYAYVMYNKAKITFKGIEYLEQNSGFAKTYKSLKELRDWIKL